MFELLQILNLPAEYAEIPHFDRNGRFRQKKTTKNPQNYAKIQLFPPKITFNGLFYSISYELSLVIIKIAMKSDYYLILCFVIIMIDFGTCYRISLDILMIKCPTNCSLVGSIHWLYYWLQAKMMLQCWQRFVVDLMLTFLWCWCNTRMVSVTHIDAALMV